MKGSKIFKDRIAKKKIATSLFVLSSSLGTMFIADKMNIDTIVKEQQIISEMTNKTLNISFVPNNPHMKNNVNLFNAITQTDIDNIAKIQGVKSVRPIDSEYNPLNGYLKVNSKSSYVELYGMSENGEDSNKESIEMVYGRSINAEDRGKNVIVLNMETVNALQIADAKSLIGTGVEINNSMYEVIGVMNVVMADERDNTNELEHSSLIPSSTAKEILARTNARNNSYSAITVTVEDGANANSVETSIYNLLYQQHDGISGYYERDVEYSLPKKLDPTLTILDNFIAYLKVSSIGVALLSLLALFKAFRKTKDNYEYEILIDSDDEELSVDSDSVDTLEEVNVENNEESNSDNESNAEKINESEEANKEELGSEEIKDEENTEEVNSVEENIDSVEEVKEKKKSYFLESNKDNILIVLLALIISVLVNNYYLSGKSIANIFNISVGIKIIIVALSAYLIKISSKN